MGDEAESADGAMAPPRPAPRTSLPKPEPPPRRSTLTERTYEPHSNDIKPAERISRALVARGAMPVVKLVRPSEIVKSMNVYAADPVAAITPLHRRPPDRHLVPVVNVIEPGLGQRFPGLVQKIQPPAPRIPVNSMPRKPVPVHQRAIHRYDNQLGAPLPAPAALPAGLFGAIPRTIVIQRPDAYHDFGFTLRHLVVYPPDTLNELYGDGRHLAVGVLGAPMDTIFVKSVRPGGPAALAGLRTGDRLVAVNGEPLLCGGPDRAKYATVVQLAQREPHTLRLTVVPWEADVLQRYFSEAAYNPESNQRVQPPQLSYPEMPAPTLTLERESRLFDAYKRPRQAALPPPQTNHEELPEYASVASLSSTGSLNRFAPQPMHDRRESDASLPSSMHSYESASTLTGREIDDSVILSRIRKSLEQKEAFLRQPSQPTGWLLPEGQTVKHREFYGRPQRLLKPSWPPTASSPSGSVSPSRIEEETRKEAEECSASVDSGTYSGQSETNPTNGDVKTRNDKTGYSSTLSQIRETTTSSGDSLGSISNGSHAEEGGEGAWVRGRAAWWAGSGGAAAAAARTAMYRSELARLSTPPTADPSVALRRMEFERKSDRREAKSLDASTTDTETSMTGSLSGNRLMITGSKYLHCPPPDGYVPESEKVQMRQRSNSTGSDSTPIKRNHITDSETWKKRCGLSGEELEKLVPPAAATNGAVVTNGNHGLTDSISRPTRPTQLSLQPPRPSSPSSPATPATPVSGVSSDDTSSVTRRQKKESQLGEEERAMRRVSYLKATWGDRLHESQELAAQRRWRPPWFTEDIAPLRRIFEEFPFSQTREKKSETSSLGATDGEQEDKMPSIQGNVQVKMVVSNGKRASDRSWKQVWAVLHGTKLYLYRHHGNQSPSGAPTTVNANGATKENGGSRDTLDVRYSMAVLADDYTKRKHVLRLTTATGELLLQADGPADADRWLKALKRHSAEPHRPPPEWAAPPEPQAPQRNKKAGRNRSPSGPPTPTLPSSPKTKTWKGRMARQLRRMQGGSSAQSPPAATGWLGAPLERCPCDAAHPGVPLAITLCATAVEEGGLKTVGIYRVPGNAAGISALAAALDRGRPPPPGDPRWADVHVASSLLKTYLRRLPDSLLTSELYPAFIAADRSPSRTREIRRLVHSLPDAHYETLKYLIEHLRRVVAHSEFNKMEARNLAIMFGPTLVRGADDDMMSLVNDMSSQCRIIESLINNYEWYFDEDERSEPELEPTEEDLAPSSGNRELLIHNVKKIEAREVGRRDIVTSIISAANRKIQRKPRPKGTCSEATDSSSGSKKSIERIDLSSDKSPEVSPPTEHHTTTLARYDGLSGLDCSAQERMKRMEMDTLAMLRRDGSNGKRIKTSTASLTGFSIDGTGDLLSSLTSTFDQKLRTINGASPLDDGNIPYADDETATIQERTSPSSARTAELKQTWLNRDAAVESSSSGSDDADGRSRFERRGRGIRNRPDHRDYNDSNDADDSEKENASNSPSPGVTSLPSPAPRPPRPHSEDVGRRALRSESLNCRDASAAKRHSLGYRSTKLKRKSGAPERGIKRRHTVGGTKDFDKDGWLASAVRASSPDLTRDCSLAAASTFSSALAPRAPLESHV